MCVPISPRVNGLAPSPPLRLVEQQRQVVMRFREVPVDVQSLTVDLLRLGHLAGQDQQIPQVVQNLEIAGLLRREGSMRADRAGETRWLRDDRFERRDCQQKQNGEACAAQETSSLRP